MEPPLKPERLSLQEAVDRLYSNDLSLRSLDMSAGGQQSASYFSASLPKDCRNCSFCPHAIGFVRSSPKPRYFPEHLSPAVPDPLACFLLMPFCRRLTSFHDPCAGNYGFGLGTQGVLELSGALRVNTTVEVLNLSSEAANDTLLRTYDAGSPPPAVSSACSFANVASREALPADSPSLLHISCSQQDRRRGCKTSRRSVEGQHHIEGPHPWM